MVKRCCAKSCYNSQLTHKIGYFGFPKNEPVAKDWAKLAGREDLLEKKLENLTKYYLCSDHFTPNDFINPNVENKALLVLQRSSNYIPMPSRFENNLEQNLQSVIQNSEKFMKFTRVESDPVVRKRRGVKRKADDDSWEIETSSNSYELREEEIEEVEYIEEIDDMCRLCAKTATDMVPIFNELGEFTNEAQSINIMPGDTIQCNDGLPQTACRVCLEKLQSCIDVINGFVNNQTLFLN